MVVSGTVAKLLEWKLILATLISIYWLMRSINQSPHPSNTNSHTSDFLPAGRTPPSVLWSSESAAARALMGGWCRPCGVTETALWACRSCWRKHETCWSSVSQHLYNADLSHASISLSSSAPSFSNLLTHSKITALAAVDRPLWLLLGTNGRTCLWTAPSRWPASAAPCAQKWVVKLLTLD